MQIYGDKSCEMSVAQFARELLARVEEGQGLASLRAVLIACGQLEQLVSDANDAGEALTRDAQRATEHAAAAFYLSWSRENANAPRGEWQLDREVHRLRERLRRLSLAGTATGRLNLPEGFAFYALYPEQYCAAAVAYLGRHGPGEGVTHVIGLRSIGTTLSATVAVVLDAAKVARRRCTVRPYGHPFDRRLDLLTPFAANDRALVVDEGPGLSGSSFFSAARALSAGGVAVSRQVYFCAHSQPPGRMASPEIRSFWQQAERYVASSYETVISSAGSLHSTLRVELSRLFGGEVTSLEDLSSGRWRALAFEGPACWPAAYPAFERPKLVARLADGRRVLLKYFGQVLRSDPVEHQVDWSDAAAARGIAESGSRVARIHGYVARYWFEGALLTVGDKSEALLEQLARFVAGRRWQRTSDERNAANAHRGGSAALAPVEWLRLVGGQILKLPDTLANYDHTAVGPEPLGWDLAQIVVEWQLTGPETEQLLGLFRAHSGLSVQPSDISSHIRNYALFHAEKARFCAALTEGEEARRLELEVLRYTAYGSGIAR